jgi:hypothetical protein
MAVDRAQLFAEIWAEPILVVAARYGVSSSYLSMAREISPEVALEQSPPCGWSA